MFPINIPNGSEDTSGHLPLRVLVIFAEVDVCRAGPCASWASPLAPSDSGGNRLGRGEHALGAERAAGEVWGVATMMVLGVGFEVT